MSRRAENRSAPRWERAQQVRDQRWQRARAMLATAGAVGGSVTSEVSTAALGGSGDALAANVGKMVELLTSTPTYAWSTLASDINRLGLVVAAAGAYYTVLWFGQAARPSTLADWGDLRLAGTGGALTQVGSGSIVCHTRANRVIMGPPADHAGEALDGVSVDLSELDETDDGKPLVYVYDVETPTIEARASLDNMTEVRFPGSGDAVTSLTRGSLSFANDDGDVASMGVGGVTMNPASGYTWHYDETGLYCNQDAEVTQPKVALAEVELYLRDIVSGSARTVQITPADLPSDGTPVRLRLIQYKDHAGTNRSRWMLASDLL